MIPPSARSRARAPSPPGLTVRYCSMLLSTVTQYY
jgi:hypothetical protein